MSKVSISVVIPTHNRCALLGRAIDSVLAQTEMPSEIIVVDDFSCAETRALVASYGLPELHYIENKGGRGPSSSRNLGVLHARSDYIAFLDDDDVFLSSKIKVVSDAILDNPAVDVFYHPAQITMVNEGVSYNSNPKFYSEREILVRKLAVSNVIGGTPMVVARRDALLSTGGFDVNLAALEDYELWIRMAIAGLNFQKIDEALTNCFYVTKKESVSKDINSNLAAFKEIELKHKTIYGSLSPVEHMQRDVWLRRLTIHKCLLNGQTRSALAKQLRLVILKPNFRDIALLGALFLGAKFVFQMKARFG